MCVPVKSILLALATGLVAASPVAAAGPGIARAQVKVFGGADHQVSWMGRGDVRKTIPLCIATPTGKFSLFVSSATGQGLVGTSALAYSVTLKSSRAAVSGTISPDQPMVELAGSVTASSSCIEGANAELLVHLSSVDLLSGNAGTYADQINLAVQAR
jgi:hypothetical protein